MPKSLSANSTSKNTKLRTKTPNLRKMVHEFDWSKTSLGPIKSWPQSLRTAANIVLNSPVPIVMLWGKEGRMIYNDAYSVFAGAKHPQLLGSKVIEGWPEVADFNQNVMDKCLAGKTLSYVDQQLTLNRHNVAEEVWMNLNYSPISDESGKPAGVLAIVVETTQRVLAETERNKAKAIAESERQKLQRFLNDAPAYIAVLNGPEHIYTLANPLYKQMVGNRDILGKSIREALPEIKDTGLYELMDEVYNSGTPYFGSEVPIGLDRTGSGIIEDGFFNFIYQPIRDENGKVTDVFIHAFEVTEQIKARSDLAEAKRMFDALFDSNVVAIAMVNMSDHILQANKTFLKMFGYTKTDLKNGITYSQLSVSGYDSVTQHIYNSVREKGEVEPTQKRYKKKDGLEFPGLIGAAMLPDSSEEFMTFILDVSENEKLKEVNDAKDEFIALASHQLRTPATSVKQYIGVLMDEIAGPLSSKQFQYLSVANNANNRQLAIINDLLKTAEIDVKGYQLSITKIDLVRTIKNIMDQYLPVLETKNQKFKFKNNNKTIYLLADEAEIGNCIGNLIENASKYSADNTTMAIELKKLSKEVKIVIKDQGVGINKEDIEKIFEKFTRIDNELSDTVSGNGLGLYWVKRIIELHHGKIDTSSKVGVGTTFSVRLPL